MKSKSRTFAIVLTTGEFLGVYFLWLVTDQETKSEILEHQAHETKWGPQEKDNLIELFKKAGLTVRFYEPEERLWMDISLTGGLTAAPGSRDGQWSFPNPEEFKRDYLVRI